MNMCHILEFDIEMMLKSRILSYYNPCHVKVEFTLKGEFTIKGEFNTRVEIMLESRLSRVSAIN